MQLNDIMNNVQRILNRYSIEQNLLSGNRASFLEYKKKRRANFLENIATYTQIVEVREKTLTNILAWLEEWNAILSEMTTMDVNEYHHWIVQMEILPETFKAIESNVKMLIKISTALFEEKKKQRKKLTSRSTLWKSWKERVIKRPATAHALRPDQMISDEFATNTKVSEIQDMLQELIGTAMFNKMENNAIKYISSTIINLSKALSVLNDELKILNLQSANLHIDETAESEKELSLKIIQDLSEKNEMFQQQLQEADEKCEHLIRSKAVIEHQLYTALSTLSSLKVLPKLSPQSSTPTNRTGDREDSMDTILTKEFETIMDEAKKKGIKGSGVKWDPGISYAVQGEMIPDLTQEQYTLPGKKKKESPEDITEDKSDQKDKTDQYRSQKRRYTKESTYIHGTSGSKLSDEQKVSGTKPIHYSEQQALGKKGKEIKSFFEAKSKSTTESKSHHIPSDSPSTEPKSQGGRSVTRGMWEQIRKAKPEFSPDIHQISTEAKVEPIPESKDKGSKSKKSSLAEPLGIVQLDHPSESQKGHKMEKKHQISPSKEEKIEEKEMIIFTKKVKPYQVVKSQPKMAKETSESIRALENSNVKSDQSNLEEFHKAIMAFLNETIDNIGKPFVKKTLVKEELLKKAEVEKLEIIKAKMEEYFQKVAEIVTKMLRKYKDIKKAEQVGEKPKELKKVVTFMPGSHFPKSPISAKSEINTLLSYENIDPKLNNLIQIILTEIESERDVPVVSIGEKDHKEKEEQRWKEGEEKISGLSLKHQMLQERNLWEETDEKINKNLEEGEAWPQMKEGKQWQQKQWQKEEMWKEQQKQGMQKWIEKDVKEKQREKEKEEYQNLEQQMEIWKQKMKEQGLLSETSRVQDEVRQMELKRRWEKEEEKQKSRRKGENHERQRQKISMDQVKIKEKKPEELEKLVSQASVTLSDGTLSPRWKTMPKDASRLYLAGESYRNLKTLDILPDRKHSIPITPPTSTQSFSPISRQSPPNWINITPEQAQELGITLTPRQVQAQGIILTLEQAQALGITLAPGQAKAQRITRTPELIQVQGVTLIPEEAQTQKVIHTPEQIQEQGITLSLQQAQAQGITLTPEPFQELGVTPTPENSQGLGVILTPEQAQAVRSPLALEQAPELQVPFTPKLAQVSGPPLTLEQAQILTAPVSPEEVQKLKASLTSEQAQAMEIPQVTEQAQRFGVPITQAQVETQGTSLISEPSETPRITLTPKQAQVQGVLLTPQEAQAHEITPTPQQAQALRISLTPVQAQAQGITLTPQQAQAQGITLIHEQTQAQGATLTLQQAQALGVTLTPEQIQAQEITLIPQEAQAQGITLASQQAQAQGIALTPEQIQAQGITLTLQQAQALGVTLTPEQAQSEGIIFTPEQAEAQGIPLTSQEAQARGSTLTPEQAQALRVTLTPEQAQAQRITLIPEQAQALGITLTPQKAQTQGITLTPEQTQVQALTLTPQQAQAQGITLTPQQAQAQGITLTPQQAQALGITLTPQQAQAQGITLTPQQAQAQGITLTPQQAQALGITLTPQQAQAQGYTLTPEPFQVLGVTPTPEDSQGLGVFLTPEQAQAVRSLTLEQTPELQVPFTPKEAQVSGPPLTLEQAQILRVPVSSEQTQKLKSSVTLEQTLAMEIPQAIEQAQRFGVPVTQAQPETLRVALTSDQILASGVTITSEQIHTVEPPLTPQQAQSLGVPLSPEQAEALKATLTEQQTRNLGVSIGLEKVQQVSNALTLKQIQALDVTPSPEQTQAFGTPLTVEQAQALEISVTPENAWMLAVTRNLEQAQALGSPLTREQAQALGVPLTPEYIWELEVPLTSDKDVFLGSPPSPEKVQPLRVPFTTGQDQSVGVTVMPEQDLKSRSLAEQPSQLWAGPPSGHTVEVGILPITTKLITPRAPHIPKRSPSLAPSTLRPFQELKASLPSEKSFTLRSSPSPRQFLITSPIAEKSPILGVSSTLHISRSPLTQGPFVGKSPEMEISSDSGKLLTPQTFPSSRQTLVSAPVWFLTPKIPPTSGRLKFGAPHTAGQNIALGSLLRNRRLFTSGGSPTPEPHRISKGHLTPRQPLKPGVPHTSGQIPSLQAPLSPGEPLVSGASSIPGELLESGPLTFPEQPQAVQFPPTPMQSLHPWTPSTHGRHLAPRILPIPGQPSPQWIPPSPGKPRKGLASSVSEKRKKGLAIISSLKSKSALIYPSTPKFKVPQVLLTAKKLQMPEVSDISEETQIFQDSFNLEQFRTFQSYLSNYRTQVSQNLYIDEGAVPTLMKPMTSLPSLTTQLPKTSVFSPSEWDPKPRFPPIDKSWILTSVPAIKKPKITVSPSSPQELEEERKRYFVDVEAQRKNLILLNQATKTSVLTSSLYKTARNLIIETLHTDTVRLGYIFHKYIAYRLIQRARNNITKQLQSIQNTGKGKETRNLYIMLNRIDDYQKKVMQIWTEKQNSLEQKRNQCLKKMIHFFRQLKERYEVHLSQPITLITDKKPIPASTEFVHRPFLELLIEEDRKSDIVKKFRKQKDQVEAIWTADLSTSSYPITEKTPIGSLWAQLGGYPDIPRLLQLDVQSTLRKSLASIQSQFKKIPK
ncbi:protein FAM186A isoform X2 [Tamandua tetradactyla]